MKTLRGRHSFLAILALTLLGLLSTFQNCAPAPSEQSNSQSDDSKIVEKIDAETNVQMLSLYEEGLASDQGANLSKSLPEGVPLVVIVRNGQLYPDVQLIVNGSSFLVAEYLKALSIFKSENFTVPIFYSPNTLKGANKAIEVLTEFRVDLGQETDSAAYCEAILYKQQDPAEAELLIQIADASGLLSGKFGAPKIYWTLPIKIFTSATCLSP